MLIAAGTVLEGKYRVERLLGAGGMGSVWIAHHTSLHRPVAVKVLDSVAASRDATAIHRFLREAQTCARLRSDHIVDVLDMGEFDDGTPFLVMELLEGETLASRIRRGRLPQGEAALLVDQLLAGLAAAHAAEVIHRDIKPDNCFITQKNGKDHLKLLDFGISKVAKSSPDAPEMRMTRTGVVMGTPYYMAPEQARGAKEIDHRCDLYAAGAILYECVTGRVPFDAESVNELLFKIVLEPLVPPRALAPELEDSF
ncbi:MAG: serine/threonine protein kinase [Sandaracinaceae bacterium]|nr:serine/threonine protein kinase [Sandaracinaceae bacterium]